MTAARTLLAAAAALLASSAPAATVEDAQAWINLTAMGSIKDRAIYFVEVQPRVAEDRPHLPALLLRGGLGWKFSDAVSLYAGYLHVVHPDRNEERPFAQLSWSMADLAGGRLSSRHRLEHRRVSTGSDVGWRLRAMLRYVHPLGPPRRPRALVSVEPFVAFDETDWGQRRGLDQVRTFAGLEVPLKGKSTIEIGYLNQAINGPGAADRMNHVASLSLLVRP